jgi:hypothetical protein
VELIEPELFFRFAPTSAINLFVDAICERIDEIHSSSSLNSNDAHDTVPIPEETNASLKRTICESPKSSKRIKMPA